MWQGGGDRYCCSFLPGRRSLSPSERRPLGVHFLTLVQEEAPLPPPERGGLASRPQERRQLGVVVGALAPPATGNNRLTMNLILPPPTVPVLHTLFFCSCPTLLATLFVSNPTGLDNTVGHEHQDHQRNLDDFYPKTEWYRKRTVLPVLIPGLHDPNLNYSTARETLSCQAHQGEERQDA